MLRIKGAKDVGKRAERATAEGLVAAKGGALVELNSETDFVAKNEEFQSVAAQIVAAAEESKAADVDALKAAKVGDKTVEEVVAELSAKIGEKLELRRVAYFDGDGRGVPAQAFVRSAARRRRARRVHRRQRRGRARRGAAGGVDEGEVPNAR